MTLSGALVWFLALVLLLSKSAAQIGADLLRAGTRSMPLAGLPPCWHMQATLSHATIRGGLSGSPWQQLV